MAAGQTSKILGVPIGDTKDGGRQNASDGVSLMGTRADVYNVANRPPDRQTARLLPQPSSLSLPLSLPNNWNGHPDIRLEESLPTWPFEQSDKWQIGGFEAAMAPRDALKPGRSADLYTEFAWSRTPARFRARQTVIKGRAIRSLDSAA